MERAPSAGNFAPWKQLLTSQVLLQNSKRDEDWGEIDLLGASDQNLPVVVELKAPRSNESPAEMLVQATAYAVAGLDPVEGAGLGFVLFETEDQARRAAPPQSS